MTRGFKCGVLSLAILMMWVDRLEALGSDPVGFALENGDVDGDLSRSPGDIVYLAKSVLRQGPAPVALALCAGATPAVENGDIDGDGDRDLKDVFRLASVVFIGGPPAAPACPDDLPRVLGLDTKPYGKDLGEWSAVWWQWAASIPVDSNPLFDETGEDCGVEQSGPVFNLVGTFLTEFVDGEVVGTARRSCSIPAGRAIYFPILNGICSNIGEDPPLTDQELIDCTAFFAGAATQLECSVDGIPVQNLEGLQVASPAFDFEFPADNIFGTGKAGASRGADNGFYVMLAPLSEGQHDINFSGAFVFTEAEFGFDLVFRLDISYEVNVVGG